MTATPVEIPRRMLAFADRGESWASWLDRLPALTRGLLAEWGLAVDGTALHGECALVVPVRTADGEAAMLKVGWPHWEAVHEHLALRAWAGRGAVRLYRADPRRSALLLERLSTRDLTTIPVLEACETVAQLYSDLHVPASPELRRLSELCADWGRRLDAVASANALPPRYVDRAASLARAFADDSDTDGVVVHTDLHYENVLAAERLPWLVIDPKPLSGDPAFEIAPMLWNRWDEIVATGRVRHAIRERFETIVDTSGVDEERAKAWVVLRMLVNAMWEIEEPSPESDDKDSWLTDAITIAKAVGD